MKTRTVSLGSLTGVSQQAAAVDVSELDLNYAILEVSGTFTAGNIGLQASPDGVTWPATTTPLISNMAKYTTGGGGGISAATLTGLGASVLAGQAYYLRAISDSAFAGNAAVTLKAKPHRRHP